jgi:hypothetical protein
MRTIVLAVVIAALLTGCGGSPRTLGDGQWYGKLTSVDVSQRRLEFAPVCRLTRPGWRWAVRDAEQRFTVPVAAHPDLSIYVRPDGNISEGHGQSTYLRLLAGSAAHGPDPDSPPGWFVTVRNGAVTYVAEDSGLRSSDPSDKRGNACVWSRRTQAVVK